MKIFRRYSKIMFMMIMTSCIHQAPAPEEIDYVIEMDDLTVALTYLNREALIARHGRPGVSEHNNPYVDYPAQFVKKKIVVFDFLAETVESAVMFTLQDSVLTMEGKRGTSKSLEYMERIWEGYARGQEMTEMRHTLKRTILPREFTVEPGVPVQGYLVFADNFPAVGGEALLEFDVSLPDGETGRLELPLQFIEDGGN